uniref:amidophosphoribosyltransferase n=1 Tax=viral metagenome TaxID=1070528 RepID=A0A6C0KGA5_9ZZZZ
MNEACGLFATYTKKSSNKNYNYTIEGLKLLQHRGQDGCGISFLDDKEKIITLKGMGMVKDFFHAEYEETSLINTYYSIGHVRYRTSGNTNNLNHLQPLNSRHSLLGTFALAHNGNIANLDENSFDTQYIVDFISKNENTTWKNILVNLLKSIPGVYCLTILTNEGIYALRDCYGVRPLCIGFKDNDYCISSESSAFHRFNLYTNINPGQIYKINKHGVTNIYNSKKTYHNICSFEFIYFLRPNSIVDTLNVNQVRQQLGIYLARDDMTDFYLKDYIVIGIPDSGIIAAKSYAETLQLEYHQWIQKYENIDRTFIYSTQKERVEKSKKKFFYNDKYIKNKKLIIVDDTIVRGNVIKTIISQLKEICPLEIHIRIPAPPIRDICKFGVDIPSKEELLIYKKTPEELTKELNIDSLKYLSLHHLDHIISKNSCKGCFSSVYKKELLNW